MTPTLFLSYASQDTDAARRICDALRATGLEVWLDRQIQFDAVWENKVVERILHNMSLLLERSFASVQELNRYRKEVSASLAARPQPQPV